MTHYQNSDAAPGRNTSHCSRATVNRRGRVKSPFWQPCCWANADAATARCLQVSTASLPNGKLVSVRGLHVLLQQSTADATVGERCSQSGWSCHLVKACAIFAVIIMLLHLLFKRSLTWQCKKQECNAAPAQWKVSTACVLCCLNLRDLYTLCYQCACSWA